MVNHGRGDDDHISSSHKESALVRFAREFGWRAYAIPVLLVITIWTVVDVVRGPADVPSEVTSAHHAQDTTTAPTPRPQGPDPASVDVVPSDKVALPPGGSYAEEGEGTFRTIGRPGAAAGKGEEKTLTYIIQVENGVDTSVYGGDDSVARFIDATLTDPRGWSHDPRFRLEHVDKGDNPELTIRIASTKTANELCGVDDFQAQTSCRTTLGGNSVVLNDARWNRGAVPFSGDIGTYRQYLVNHEVGHALGYARHSPCAATGELAPIMMQQTISLNNSHLHALVPEEVYPNDGATCRYNGWPYPNPETGPTT